MYIFMCVYVTCVRVLTASKKNVCDSISAGVDSVRIVVHQMINWNRMTAMSGARACAEQRNGQKNYNNATSKVIPMDLNSFQFIFVSIAFDEIACQHVREAGAHGAEKRGRVRWKQGR